MSGKENAAASPATSGQSKTPDHHDRGAWLRAGGRGARRAARQRPLQPAAREAQYVSLTSQTHTLGLRYARVKGHACQALAKRLLRHEDELFQFVLLDGLSIVNSYGLWEEPMATRTPFILAESARVRGGSIHVQHSHLCGTHRGEPCGCSPSYKLRREQKVRGR
jgi:hypothetical protein